MTATFEGAIVGSCAIPTATRFWVAATAVIEIPQLIEAADAVVWTDVT